MDFVGLKLISISQPKGVWPSILNAFAGGVKSYIWAVILVAIIVRFLFSFLDVINKKVTMKNSSIMEKMKPELEAIQKKYGNDTRLMQQKQSEVYRKYQFGMLGSCLPMLITMVLQFVVFLTLWTALRNVSEYNIVTKYEDMKNIYANVIALNEEDILTTNFTDGDEVKIEIENNIIHIFVNNSEVGTSDVEKNITNEGLYDNIKKYVNNDA